MGNNDLHDLLTKIDSGQESEPASSDRFDHYRSLADSNLMILVAKNVVPPFRFKAGGWELCQSSIELGPSIKARIAEKGFLMFRVDEDQTRWTELIDLPPFPPPMLNAKTNKSRATDRRALATSSATRVNKLTA